MNDGILIPPQGLHIVRWNGEHVVFHPPSFTFYRVNASAADMLSDYAVGLHLNELCQKYKATEKEIESVFAVIQQEIESSTSEAQKKKQERQDWRKKRAQEATGKENPVVLRRLTLNISNDCNLRCRYCYADTGAYGSARGLMEEDVALRAMDAVYHHFDGVDMIQFFGGEPALNVPVIQTVCEYMDHLLEEDRIKYKPDYAIVTNGTISSPELFEVIKKHHIGLTVSLDGPKEVNDEIRVYPHGRGSYDRIMNFIEQARENSDSYLGIEGTYTARHIELGISMVDLLDFFAEELDITSPHIPTVGAPADPSLALHPRCSEETYRIYADAVSHTVWSATTDHPRSLSLAQRQVDALVRKQGQWAICPASGGDTLSVDMDGGIYPCFMFIGREEFRMGDVNGDGFGGPGFDRVNTVFWANVKGKRDDCSVCWARGLCSGCLGAVYNETGSITDVPQDHCELVKAMGERTLVELARVRNDPEKWEKMVETMTRVPDQRQERDTEDSLEQS